MRAVITDVPKIPTVSKSHDCGSLSRVVMVRKTDHRMINHKKPESDPQCEFLTYETIQTYRGHKPDRTIVMKEKHDMVESEAQKSPCAQRFLRSSTNSASETPNGHLSSEEKLEANDQKEINASETEQKKQPPQRQQQINGKTETDVSKKRVTIAKSSITPPVSSSNTPQRVRRSQSLSSTRSTVFTEFEKACLKAHNEYRAKHFVPPLKLNKRLCRFSEEWAKILASRGTPVHRNNSPYGENIFCMWSSISNTVVKGWEPVEHWYSENVNHAYGKEPSTLKTGHFTQVIWRDSLALGVGMAKNRTGQIFVVANYDPPGNFIGSFTENVPPIGGFDDDQMDKMKSLTSYESFLEPDKVDDLNLEIFIKAILRYHNEYRRKHGAPELKLSKKLCSVSQEWADVLAAEDRFAHRPNSNYGENIYCLWSSDRNAKANPREVVRSWYEEIKEHDFNIEPKGIFKAGHFTQLVWKSSQDLGVGVSKTKKGKVLVVCNYNPRGNTAGQFGTNVLKTR